MQQALRTAFADLSTEYPLYFRTGNFKTDHFIYCKKISPSAQNEQQQSMMVGRDFQISLRASNPCFLSYYQKLVDVSPPSVAPADDYLLATIHNSGNYRARPIFRTYGPSSGVTFTNDATGQSFSLGAIPFGKYYEFNMGSPPTSTIYLKDDLGNNVWNMLTDGSQYIDLVGCGPRQGVIQTGDNNIFYSGDSPRVQISWFDTWM
jgi:hypothetical protein